MTASVSAVRRSRKVGGFTLLEVLVAIAILGLGLTVVLSAQTGVFWSYQRATRLSQAPGLLRCRMAELELDMMVTGYPLLDITEEGECCEDQEVEGYSCSWQVQRVELPDLPLDGEGGLDAGAPTNEDAVGTKGDEGAVEPSGAAPASSGPGGAGGPLGALMAIQQTGGAALGDDPTVGGLAGMMGGGDGITSLAASVMSLVYPDLKPMLEASIRKVTVKVHWKEGKRDKELEVTQYLASPQQGGFDPLAETRAEAIGDAIEEQVQ